MDERAIEPRKVMWAVAEVAWEDDSGTSFRAPATLEDTSPSGACVRVQRPFNVGSRLTIRWHREQFSAVARNCRSDGTAFLLGLLREHGNRANVSAQNKPAKIPAPIEAAPEHLPTAKSEHPQIPSRNSARAETARPTTPPIEPETNAQQPDQNLNLLAHSAALASIRQANESPPPSPQPSPNRSGTPVRSERKVMQPKTLFPQFWRRQQDGEAPAKSTSTEAPVNKPSTHATDAANGPRGDLLSYEDIYRAAGIMSPGAGYGIHKIVEMLNSERIRDLAKDVKRASVLMALDAAGISVDELLTDATRRQNALNAYEAAQRKQLEDFEAHKAKENSRIEEEIEKIRAHYAQRIQANLDQVTKEREALRNWQNAMQSESQRIAEVIELCGQQPAPAKVNSLAAAVGAQGTGENSTSALKGAS